MNRIDRLFGILTLLQSRKFLSAEFIAEKFGMSVRTVYRDIKALIEQGIPVSFEQNKGYFIVKGYFLPPVAFTPDEANAMVLMETMVQGFADRSIFKHYSSALNKMKAVMSYSQKEKLEELNSQIKLQLPERMANDYEYLTLLQQGISGRQILTLSYKNNLQEVSKREVEPIGLIFYAFSWHLIAFCHYRKEYRDFKVSRILNVLSTGKPYEIKEHLTLNDYMKMLPVDF